MDYPKTCRKVTNRTELGFYVRKREKSEQNATWSFGVVAEDVAEHVWQRTCGRGRVAEGVWQRTCGRGRVAEGVWQSTCGRARVAGHVWQS
eukprot:186346-Prymnesium_polylepis.1